MKAVLHGVVSMFKCSFLREVLVTLRTRRPPVRHPFNMRYQCPCERGGHQYSLCVDPPVRSVGGSDVYCSPCERVGPQRTPSPRRDVRTLRSYLRIHLAHASSEDRGGFFKVPAVKLGFTPIGFSPPLNLWPDESYLPYTKRCFQLHCGSSSNHCLLIL